MFNKRDLLNIEAAMILYAVKYMESKRNVSKNVNMSLDTIAKYINNLEAELGRKLITANGRGCHLTTVGEIVVFQASLIHKCLEKIYELKFDNKEIKGDVYIAYDQRINSYLHATALKELSKNYPNVTVCMDNCKDIPHEHNSKYDIFLSYNPPKNQNMIKVDSWEIPFNFFATSEYLKIHSTPRNIQDLVTNHNLLMNKEDWHKIKETVGREKSKSIFFTNDLVIIKDVTAGDSGIGVMPYYFNKIEKNLVRLDNIECSVTNTLYLISPKNRKDIPRVKAITGYYQELISNL